MNGRYEKEKLIADSFEKAEKAILECAEESQMDADCVLKYPTQPPGDTQLQKSQRDRW